MKLVTPFIVSATLVAAFGIIIVPSNGLGGEKVARVSASAA